MHNTINSIMVIIAIKSAISLFLFIDTILSLLSTVNAFIINEKQAIMSNVKPRISIISHIIEVEELIKPLNIYHFDINTMDNGIPEIKNNNNTIRYLYIFESIYITSFLFIFSNENAFCKTYNNAN